MNRDFFFNIAAGFVFIVLVCGSIILADYVFFEGQLLKRSESSNRTLSSQLKEEKRKNDQLQTELKMAATEMNQLIQKMEAEGTSQKVKTLMEENQVLKDALKTPEHAFLTSLEDAMQGISGIELIDGKFIFHDDIFFQPASTILSKEAKKTLNHMAKTIETLSAKIDPEASWVIKVMGHADAQKLKHPKPFSSNWILASSRAIKIVQYLIGRGVDPTRLYAAGYTIPSLYKGKTHAKSSKKARRAVISFDRRVGDA